MGQPKRRPGRGDVYYANTRVGAVRLRECLDTENYQEALRRQRQLVAKVEADQIAADSNPQWLRYKVAEALDVLHQQRHDAGQKEGTLRIERDRAKPLKLAAFADINQLVVRPRIKHGKRRAHLPVQCGKLWHGIFHLKMWRRIGDYLEPTVICKNKSPLTH